MRRGLLLVALLGSSLALPPTVRFGADLNEEPIVVGRALPGAHTVRVVAVDRAGNRSRPALRRIETQ